MRVLEFWWLWSFRREGVGESETGGGWCGRSILEHEVIWSFCIHVNGVVCSNKSNSIKGEMPIFK